MKNIDLNKESDLIALKESFEKQIDKRIANARLNESLDKIGLAHFGELKQLFEETLSKIYDDESGKKTLSKYVKLIKENKTLNTMYRIYESIEKPSDISNPNTNLMIISELCSAIDKKSLLEGEKKLRKIILEAVKYAGLTSENINDVLGRNREINESVNHLVFNGASNSKNFTKGIKSFNILFEAISNKTVKNEDETKVSNKELAENLKTLTENCEHTNWEKAVIHDLSLCDLSNGSHEALFENYKNKCVEVIDNLCEDKDVSECSRFYSMKTQLLEKKYNEDTFIDDLFKLSELKTELED